MRFTTLIILLFFAACNSVSIHDINISEENFEKIQRIRAGISNNYETITDSVGWYSKMYFYGSGRFKEKLSVLPDEDYKNLVELFEKGVLNHKIIINNRECITFELMRGPWIPVVNKYQEVVYLGYNKNCSCSCEEDDRDRRIDKDWSIFKTRDRRFPH